MLNKSNLPHLPEFFPVGKRHMDIKFFHNDFSEVLPSFFQKEDPSSVQPWTIFFLWLQCLIHLKIKTTHKYSKQLQITRNTIPHKKQFFSTVIINQKLLSNSIFTRQKYSVKLKLRTPLLQFFIYMELQSMGFAKWSIACSTFVRLLVQIQARTYKF